MKKIISLLVLLSSVSFGQVVNTKSISDIKQQLAISLQQSVSSNQLQKSDVLHRISGIQNLKADNQKKNPALAIFYSMLLPGMGELYAGSYESGKYFTIADGLLWGVFSGFEIYGNWKENNYKSFAESKGGVNLSGKDANYFATIGIYLNINEYNTAMELNREFSKTYNTTTSYWKWNSEEQRREYRDMWSSSEQAFNNVRFVVGALILNRLISAINAVRLVSAYNKNLPQEISWNISVGISNTPTIPSTLTINFLKTF